MGKEAMKKMKRLNLTMPEEFYEYMDKIIERGDTLVSYSELIRRAVKTYGRISDDVKSGKKIFAEDKEGNRTEYIIII